MLTQKTLHIATAFLKLLVGDGFALSKTGLKTSEMALEPVTVEVTVESRSRDFHVVDFYSHSVYELVLCFSQNEPDIYFFSYYCSTAWESRIGN